MTQRAVYISANPAAMASEALAQAARLGPRLSKTASPNRLVPAVTAAPCQAYVSTMGSCYYAWIGLRRRPRCKRSIAKSGTVGGQSTLGGDQILLRPGKRHVISACPLPASHPSSLRSRLTIHWRNSAECSLRPDR